MPDALSKERLAEIDEVLGLLGVTVFGGWMLRRQVERLQTAARDLRAEVTRLRSVCDEFIWGEEHGDADKSEFCSNTKGYDDGT